MRPELGTIMQRLYSANDADGFAWRVALSTENPRAHITHPTDPHSRYSPARFEQGDCRGREGSITNVGLYDALTPHIPAVKSSLASARSHVPGLPPSVMATWDQVLHIFDGGQLLVPFLMMYQGVDPSKLGHEYLVLAEASTGMLTGIGYMLRTIFNKNIQMLDHPVDDEQMEYMKKAMIKRTSTPMANSVRPYTDGGEPILRVCPAPWGMVEGMMNAVRLGLPKISHGDLFAESIQQTNRSVFQAFVETQHRDRLNGMYGAKAVTKREQRSPL